MPKGTKNTHKSRKSTPLSLEELARLDRVPEGYPFKVIPVKPGKWKYWEFEDGTKVSVVFMDITQLYTPAGITNWSPAYWDLRVLEAIETLQKFAKKNNFQIVHLGELLQEGVEGLTYGATATGKDRFGSFVKKPSNNSMLYLTTASVRNTGILISKARYARKNSPLASNQNWHLRAGDIVMNRSGVGTALRCCVVTDEILPAVVSDDVIKIRLAKRLPVTPEFLCVFLQCKYGRLQLERATSGVSGQVHIDFDELRGVLVPVVDRSFQRKFVKSYKQVLRQHYAGKIKKAEKLLKNLTEELEKLIEN